MYAFMFQADMGYRRKVRGDSVQAQVVAHQRRRHVVSGDGNRHKRAHPRTLACAQNPPAHT
jgi:hypothetical protein